MYTQEKKGSSLLETRRRNRAQIKNTIFNNKRITRNKLAEELGLTIPTITTSINEMMEEGILREISSRDKKTPGKAGRKPGEVEFAPDAAFAIGVDLGGHQARTVLMNIKGEILETSVENLYDENYETMLWKLAGQIKEIQKKAFSKPVKGVGVGLPGFIDKEKGMIQSCPIGNWDGRHLAQDLEEIINLPVMIDNNTRLRAMRYGMELQRRKTTVFAYFFVYRGIACPIMVGNDALAGYTAGAGEVAYNIFCVEEGDGKKIRKTLADFASEKHIFERCREVMTGGGGLLLQKMIQDSGEFTIKQVLDAQEEGDQDISPIVEEAVEYLGIALANIVNLVTPEFAVVEGPIMDRAFNAEKMEKISKHYFHSVNGKKVDIKFTPFNEYNSALGGAYLALKYFFLEQ